MHKGHLQITTGKIVNYNYIAKCLLQNLELTYIRNHYQQ